MTNKKMRLLIVDDSIDSIKILISILKDTYDISFATNGLKGIEIAKSGKIDLVLLDILMPDIDGYEICKILKGKLETKDIPIIFVTAVSESVDEAKGFSLGCVDYIKKPYEPIVVLARIENQIKASLYLKELKHLYKYALDANPITKLPGNSSIQTQIERLVEEKERQCVMYADLDHFKAYNDKYGFLKGDLVINETAEVLKEAANNLFEENTFFIGHIGGDDFYINTPCERAKEYMENVISLFDERIKKYYNEVDKKNGYILSKDRNGNDEKYDFVSISIAGISLCKHSYTNYVEVIDDCAEQKKRAKNIKGSSYVCD